MLLSHATPLRSPTRPGDRRVPAGRELGDLLMMCGYEDQAAAKILLKAKHDNAANPTPPAGAGVKPAAEAFRRVKSFKEAGGAPPRKLPLNPVEVPSGACLG